MANQPGIGMDCDQGMNTVLWCDLGRPAAFRALAQQRRAGNAGDPDVHYFYALFIGRRLSCSRGEREQRAATDLDFDIDLVMSQDGFVYFDAETRRLGNHDLAIPVGADMAAREVDRELARLEGIFADSVLADPGIGLQRRAQREMRREGVVHIRDPARRRIIRNLFRRSNPAYAAAIDLNEADATEL